MESRLGKSAAVKKRPFEPAGASILVIVAWATGLRTKTASWVPGIFRSDVYSPRPLRKRLSSLRVSRAPTPFLAVTFTLLRSWIFAAQAGSSETGVVTTTKTRSTRPELYMACSTPGGMKMTSWRRTTRRSPSSSISPLPSIT